MSAFAALSLVCIVSSCKDQNFDWENVHSLTSVEKFTDTFIKEFGQPAEGHQWGFDMPWNEINKSSSTRSIDHVDAGDGTGTGLIVKLETGATPDEWKIAEQYGTVPAITDQEHRDVYAWFSAHKVTWDNTTIRVGHINDQGVSYKFYDAPTNGNEITNIYNGLVIDNGRVEKYNSVGELVDTVKGKICINTGGTPGTIVKLVSFDLDSPSNTRNVNGGTAKLITGGSAILENTTLKTEYKSSKDWNVGMEVNFNYAWIQHVASTKYDSDGKDQLGLDYDEQSVCPSSAGDYFNYDSGSMNYLELFGTDRKHAQSKDYNKGLGPGYGWTINTAQLMGILALGIDFNQLSYKNSSDGDKYHDKWYIVYLEGGTGDQKYAGWYLGFDLEGSKEENESGQYAANGICNDWIIKLTSVATKPEKGRIMCEDLGGLNNEVTIGSGENKKVHISDIDYNDIVIDFTPCRYDESAGWIEYNENDANYNGAASFPDIKLTLQAAGGTLPLTVWYDNTCLFETHEMFEKGKFYADNDRDVDYSIMYRTSADGGNDNKQAKSFYIHFHDDWVPDNIIKENNRVVGFQYSKWTPFDLEKLHLRVWRHSAEDYKAQTQGLAYSPADWIDLLNYAGDAPLKICVPQSVKWLKERKAIHTGYPSFMEWVKDPSYYFWNKNDIVSGNLF